MTNGDLQVLGSSEVLRASLEIPIGHGLGPSPSTILPEPGASLSRPAWGILLPDRAERRARRASLAELHRTGPYVCAAPDCARPGAHADFRHAGFTPFALPFCPAHRDEYAVQVVGLRHAYHGSVQDHQRPAEKTRWLRYRLSALGVRIDDFAQLKT